MSAYEAEKTRGVLQKFLARKGHGALTDMEERTGVSRQTIARFRDGSNPDMNTLLKVGQVLSEEGLLTLSSTGVITISSEHAPEATQPRLRNDSVVVRDCPSCGEPAVLMLNGQKVNFCCICGEPIGRVCQACGHLNRAEATRCADCHAPFTSTALDEDITDEEELADLAKSGPDRRADRAQKRRDAARKHDRDKGAPGI